MGVTFELRQGAAPAGLAGFDWGGALGALAVDAVIWKTGADNEGSDEKDPDRETDT